MNAIRKQKNSPLSIAMVNSEKEMKNKGIKEISCDIRKLNMSSLEKLMILSELIIDEKDKEAELLIEKIFDNLKDNYKSISFILNKYNFEPLLK